MDRIPTPVPGQSPPDPTELAMAEIDGAISLVLRGAARTVQIFGMPGAQDAAGVGAAHAQEAAVAFRIERDARGGITMVVGPKRDG